MGYIDSRKLERLAESMGDNAYRRYLLDLLDEDPFPTGGPSPS
jgi:hypothetical protein